MSPEERMDRAVARAVRMLELVPVYLASIFVVGFVAGWFSK